MVEVFNLEGYADVTQGVGLNFGKARGNIASPLVVNPGDTVGVIRGKAYDGTAFATISNIRTKAQSVSGVNISARFEFALSDTAGVIQTRMTIDEVGNVAVGNLTATTKLHVDGPIRCKSYTVAGVPSASASGAGAQIYVSNEAGGAVLAFSDGTAWRRVTDRVVV